jgi:hypothetical protein
MKHVTLDLNIIYRVALFFCPGIILQENILYK